MESRAVIKHIRISPIKLRTLVDGIKKMHPQTALDYLGLSQKRTAKVLYKVIKSAVDNGKNKIDFQDRTVHFKKLSIDGGSFLKRFRAGSKGMGKSYKRKSSHVTVIIEQTQTVSKNIEKKEKVVKQAEKDEQKKTNLPSKSVQKDSKKKVINKKLPK